jgi:hypothetical protein
MLLEQYLMRQKVETAKRQMRSASPEAWAEYVDEFRQFDVTANDGLTGLPWEQ